MKLSSMTYLLSASLFLCTPLMASAQTAPAAGAAKAARTVTITGSDQMKYDTSTISAKPGETLHIVLKNAGTMPKIAMAHNVVILKPGTDGAAFTSAGMTSRETDFVAPAHEGQRAGGHDAGGRG